MTASPSRRAFLKSAAFAAALPAASLSKAARLAAAEPAGEADLIDAHVHVWTPDVTRYPLAAGFSKADMRPPSFTPEELFAECRPAGVGRVVLIQMSFYGFDDSYMLDSIARFPDAFRGVAIVDERRPDLAAEMRRLAGLGVRGFRLYADRAKAEAWADSPAMRSMWIAAADTGLALCLLANPDALPAVRRMAARFPKTRVVVDHFARVGMTGEIREAEVVDLCRLAERDDLFVKTSAFYALGAKRPPYADLGPLVRRLRDAFGADRLMWASDCPFQVGPGHTYADSIALVRDPPRLPDAGRQGVAAAEDRRTGLLRLSSLGFD